MNSDIKIVAFDVFGTVVDWCGSIAKAVNRFLPEVDGYEFARVWRAGYRPALNKVLETPNNWVSLDDIHLEILKNTLEKFNIHHLSNVQIMSLNFAWHQLQTWPDSLAGIHSIKEKHIVTTLSNGNISLLTHMAKNAGIAWDCILSAENFRSYKPNPSTYLGVANIFNVAPEQVLLVAAHQHDLDAAHACGLKTAYIERKMEFGLGHEKDTQGSPENTFHATDLIDLSKQLRY